MIAACPQCQTRFRLAREKIGPQGARIRCSQCQNVFKVQAPEGSPPTPVEATPSPVAVRPAPAAAAPQPVRVAPPAPAARPAPPKPLPPLARALVAEADAELAKGIADLLARWRISSEIVEDGAEALLALFRNPPELAVLGARLPSLSAAAIAEVARRSSALAGTRLVRAALAAERGAPGFDADAMLEPGDLPAGLGSVLEQLRLGAKPGAAAAPAPAAAPVQTTPAPARPAAAPAGRPVPNANPEIAAAERLARIAVSDVILYNEQKFAAAAAAGNAAKALAVEIEEARQHFNSRVSAALRAERDFLVEELERRAQKQRG